jgi:hypothetical protein
MPVNIDGTNDAWYESEPRTRVAMIREMQRIRRRTRVRPWPVIVLALAITAGVTYKLATRKQVFYAEVVLALHEGSMIDRDKKTGLPLGELKELVKSVLLPDSKVAEVIERHDLVPLRKRLGIQYAINDLRENIQVEVWRNSFVYYDPEQPNRVASARIGLTVADNDPDRASEVARDLADIVIAEVRARRLELSKKVAGDIAVYRESLETQMSALERERSERMVQQARAENEGKKDLAQALRLRTIEIDGRQKRLEKTISDINKSQEGLADRIAEAGLDLVIEVVSERRPVRPDSKGLIITMIAVVVGVGSLLGCALVLGAFDSRVHDIDDVARLGLPVLGHVPDFPGSGVGSLEARGVQRTRTPLFRRWRSR